MDRLFATPMMRPRLPFMSPSKAMARCSLGLYATEVLWPETGRNSRQPCVPLTAQSRLRTIASQEQRTDGRRAMGYAGERIMCDADSHIMETFDWLKRHADPDIRDALP